MSDMLKPLFNVALSALVLFGNSLFAAEPAPPRHDYSVIAERNPFGLRPPPRRATNSMVTTPAVDLLLTGIVSFGKERVYLMTKPKKGETPRYYCLGVGDERDGLEVVDIDLAEKSVRLRRAGSESLMTFEANGVKPPPIVPAPAPKQRGMISSQPNVTVPVGKPQQRIRLIPSRPLRTSGVSPAARPWTMPQHAKASQPMVPGGNTA